MRDIWLSASRSDIESSHSMRTANSIMTELAEVKNEIDQVTEQLDAKNKPVLGDVKTETGQVKKEIITEEDAAYWRAVSQIANRGLVPKPDCSLINAFREFAKKLRDSTDTMSAEFKANLASIIPQLVEEGKKNKMKADARVSTKPVCWVCGSVLDTEFAFYWQGTSVICMFCSLHEDDEKKAMSKIDIKLLESRIAEIEDVVPTGESEPPPKGTPPKEPPTKAPPKALPQKRLPKALPQSPPHASHDAEHVDPPAKKAKSQTKLPDGQPRAFGPSPHAQSRAKPYASAGQVDVAINDKLRVPGPAKLPAQQTSANAGTNRLPPDPLSQDNVNVTYIGTDYQPPKHAAAVKPAEKPKEPAVGKPKDTPSAAKSRSASNPATSDPACKPTEKAPEPAPKAPWRRTPAETAQPPAPAPLQHAAVQRIPPVPPPPPTTNMRRASSIIDLVAGQQSPPAALAACPPQAAVSHQRDQPGTPPPTRASSADFLLRPASSPSPSSQTDYPGKPRIN